MGRLLYLVFLFCLFVSGLNTVFAATVQLPQSGQATCYDTNGNVITCSGTGQGGARGMGAPWPNPRFVVNGDCVTDNLTGLMWVKIPDSTLRSWADAFTYADNLDLCGYTDWRLPNVNELRGLAHSGHDEETCGGSLIWFF